MSDDYQQVTRLIQQWREGDRSAESGLIAATYRELRRIAQGLMRHERASHTLQPTALVHEAYMRLFRGAPVDVPSREAFVGLMAAQMRRVLIDHSRRRSAEKRGGGVVPAPLEEEAVAAVPEQGREEDEAFLCRLDTALERLAELYPRTARVIQLRFFGGLSIEETARAVKLSAGTIKRELLFGRTWLARELQREDG